MSVKLRVYISGNDYKDFEGESEECIKSMPEFQEAIEGYGYTKKRYTLKDYGEKYDYIILEGAQDKISNQIVNHLNKGYKIQATHVATWGGSEGGYDHIVHLIKEAY